MWKRIGFSLVLALLLISLFTEVALADQSFEQGFNDWIVRNTEDTWVSTTNEHTALVVNNRYSDGSKSVRLGSKVAGDSSYWANSDWTQTTVWKGQYNLTSATGIWVDMADIQYATQHYGWGWGMEADLIISDGVKETRSLLWFFHEAPYGNMAGQGNWYHSIVTGADGQNWYRYYVPLDAQHWNRTDAGGVPFTDVNLSSVKVGVSYHAISWHSSPQTLWCNGLVDNMRIDHPPLANNDAYTTNEDTALSILAPGVLGNDWLDGSTKSALLVTPPNHGSLILNANGSFTYIPASNFNGTDSFNYKANDGKADSNIATVTISIAAINDAPVAQDQSVTTRQDKSVTIALLATDPDGDPIPHWWPWINPTHGTVSYVTVSPNWTYMPNPGYTGVDRFVFKVADPSGAQGMATVTIQVMPNNAPIAYNQLVTTIEDTPITIKLHATDPDGDPIPHWWPWINPTHGTISYVTVGPNWTYKPNPNYYGPDSFVFKVADAPYGAQGMAMVTITVTPVNDGPPVAVNDSYSTNEDIILNVPVSGVLGNDSDIDGDQMKAVKITDPSHGTLVLRSDGSFSYMPIANYYGLDSFTYKAQDIANAESNVATVSITVAAVNDPPVANAGGPYNGVEGSPVAFSGSGTDIDGDPLTFSWAFGDTGSGSGSNPSHIYLENGDYTVVLTVTDNNNGSATSSTTAKILNAPPVAEAGQDTNIPEGTKFRFQGSFTDPGVLDTQTYKWTFGDGNSAIGSLTPEYTYGDNGVYAATLTVTDDDGGVSTDTVKVTASNVSPVVEAGPDQIVYSGQLVNFAGSFKDPGSLDTHTINWAFGDGSTATGTLTPTHVYLPPGTYTITLTVTDDDGGTGTDTLKVTVRPIMVTIDIKPGSDPNSINLNGNGAVPVGVFGSAVFNVNDINRGTVRFGVTGKEAVPVHDNGCGHIEALNSDAFNDMVFHFTEGLLGIPTTTPANAVMSLYITGQLNNGFYFEGTDVVRITPNNENSQGKGGKGPK